MISVASSVTVQKKCLFCHKHAKLGIKDFLNVKERLSVTTKFNLLNPIKRDYVSVYPHRASSGASSVSGRGGPLECIVTLENRSQTHSQATPCTQCIQPDSSLASDA